MAAFNNPHPPAALPAGTRLEGFELRRVLGIGGFGIVYLAYDDALQRDVAIKEYMPTALAGRSSGGQMVSLLLDSHTEAFALGLRSFVNEARLLARFDVPGLVKVHRYWEANNTAYMAMPFYSGSTLQAVRRRMDSPPTEAWLRGIVQPLLVALERLHREGIYHRDIAPDNVILQPDGQPVLLDLGAARQVLSDKSVALTAILKPAYAPIEQYAEASATKQGAWTDFYALGATLHYMLLGKAPPPATARAVDDDMAPLATTPALRATCTRGFLEAIDWMLQPRPADRPQSVAALRIAFAPRVDDGVDDRALDNAERTMVDLPQRPPAPLLRPRAQPGDEATVLLPRRDAPTVLQPGRAAPPAPLHDEATILMPRPDAQADIPTHAELSLQLPLDSAAGARRSAFAEAHEPTLHMPPPGTSAAPAPHASREARLPRPAAGPRPAVLAAAALGLAAAGLAAWLALKPAPAPPAAVVSPGAANTATTATGGTKTTNATAATTATIAADPAPTLPPTTQPAAVVAPPADTAQPPRAGARTATNAPGGRPAPAMRAPETKVLRTTAATPTPTPTDSPRSLATSITRLPPATEPVAATTPQATAAAPAAVAPVQAAPVASAGARSTDTPVPRAAAREADTVSLQSRALSPAERCGSRSGAAQSACIDRICRADVALRAHSDCANARRDTSAP